MKIIVDAMGGDNAPLEIVRGALDANRNHGVEIILVGRTAEVLKAVEACGQKSLPAGVEIKDAKEVVEIADDPAMAFKQKPDSSLTVGLNLLKDGAGDAFVSAGSTGALLSGATLVVKRIRGIRRAAMGPPDSHRRGTGGPLRLRRQRRVHAGVPAPVCVPGQLLRPAGHGHRKAPGGPSEHRCGGGEGRHPAP